MSFLLKIVQGPNAGAEIALVEGLCVKLGRAESCDLVLADNTLPEVACEIDTSAEGVMLFLPGGVRERMEPFHVRLFGSTAIAIGPADAPWGELVWPAPQKKVAEEPASETAALTAPASTAVQPQKKRRGLGWLIDLVLLLIFLVLVALALFWFRKPLWAFVQDCLKGTQTTISTVAETVKAPGTLSALAERYGLEVRQSDGATTLFGNLKTRAERLSVTAEAYSIQPYLTIDLSDDESLRTGAEDLLAMLTEGQVTVFSAKNRHLELQGRMGTPERMKRVLEALNADVPHVEAVDCSRVVCDGTLEPAPTLPSLPTKETKKQEANFTQMPFCGILATPYPCLVLRDGTRLMEGAELGGFILEQIAPDHITVRDKAGATFTWYP